MTAILPFSAQTAGPSNVRFGANRPDDSASEAENSNSAAAGEASATDAMDSVSLQSTVPNNEDSIGQEARQELNKMVENNKLYKGVTGSFNTLRHGREWYKALKATDKELSFATRTIIILSLAASQLLLNTEAGRPYGQGLLEAVFNDAPRLLFSDHTQPQKLLETLYGQDTVADLQEKHQNTEKNTVGNAAISADLKAALKKALTPQATT